MKPQPPLQSPLRSSPTKHLPHKERPQQEEQQQHQQQQQQHAVDPDSGGHHHQMPSPRRRAPLPTPIPPSPSPLNSSSANPEQSGSFSASSPVSHSSSPFPLRRTNSGRTHHDARNNNNMSHSPSTPALFAAAEAEPGTPNSPSKHAEALATISHNIDTLQTVVGECKKRIEKTVAARDAAIEELKQIEDRNLVRDKTKLIDMLNRKIEVLSRECIKFHYRLSDVQKSESETLVNILAAERTKQSRTAGILETTRNKHALDMKTVKEEYEGKIKALEDALANERARPTHTDPTFSSPEESRHRKKLQPLTPSPSPGDDVNKREAPGQLQINEKEKDLQKVIEIIEKTSKEWTVPVHKVEQQHRLRCAQLVLARCLYDSISVEERKDAEASAILASVESINKLVAHETDVVDFFERFLHRDSASDERLLFPTIAELESGRRSTLRTSLPIKSPETPKEPFTPPQEETHEKKSKELVLLQKKLMEADHRIRSLVSFAESQKADYGKTVESLASEIRRLSAQPQEHASAGGIPGIPGFSEPAEEEHSLVQSEKKRIRDSLSALTDVPASMSPEASLEMRFAELQEMLLASSENETADNSKTGDAEVEPETKARQLEVPPSETPKPCSSIQTEETADYISGLEEKITKAETQLLETHAKLFEAMEKLVAVQMSNAELTTKVDELTSAAKTVAEPKVIGKSFDLAPSEIEGSDADSTDTLGVEEDTGLGKPGAMEKKLKKCQLRLQSVVLERENLLLDLEELKIKITELEEKLQEHQQQQEQNQQNGQGSTEEDKEKNFETDVFRSKVSEITDFLQPPFSEEENTGRSIHEYNRDRKSLDLGVQVEMIKTAVFNARSREHELLSRVEESNTRSATLENELAERTKDIQSLEAERMFLQTAVQEKETLITELQGKYSRVVSKLKEMQQHLQFVVSEHDNLGAQNEALSKELETLKTHLEESEGQHNVEMQRAKFEYQVLVDELNKQVQEYQAECENYKQRLVKISEARVVEENSRLLKQEDDGNIQNLTAELEEMKKIVDSLTQKLEDVANTHEAELFKRDQHHNEVVKSLEEEVEKHTQDVLALRQKLENNAKSDEPEKQREVEMQQQHVINSLTTKLVEMQNAFVALNKKLSDASNAHNEELKKKDAELQNKVTVLNEQFERIISESYTLKEQMNEVKEKSINKEEHEAKMQDLRQEIEELKSASASARSLQFDIPSTPTSRSLLTLQTTSQKPYEKDKEGQEDEFEDDEDFSLDKFEERRQNRLEKVQSTFEQLTTRVVSLESVSNESEVHRITQQHKEEMEEEKKKYLLELKDLNAKIAEAHEKYVCEQKERARLEKKIAELSSSEGEIEKIKETFKQQIAQVEQEARDRLEAEKERCRNLEEKMAELQIEVATRTQETDELRLEIRRARKMLRDMETELEQVVQKNVELVTMLAGGH